MVNNSWLMPPNTNPTRQRGTASLQRSRSPAEWGRAGPAMKRLSSIARFGAQATFANSFFGRHNAAATLAWSRVGQVFSVSDAALADNQLEFVPAPRRAVASQKAASGGPATLCNALLAFPHGSSFSLYL
jgi:hypothetical protein